MLHFFKKNRTIIQQWCYALVAIVVGILGLFNFISTQIILSIFCGLIGVILISFIAQHKQNINIENMLADKFNVIEDIASKSANSKLDDLFYQDNEACESEIISIASHELILIQETGNLIIERNKETLRNFLQNGGTLTIVICGDSNTTQSYLAFRNKDLHTCEGIDLRLKNFLSQIQSTVNTGIIGKNLEKNVVVRFCPYPIAITAVFSPDTHIKRAVVRFADFKASYQEKISLVVEETNSPLLYEHYKQQIADYHLYSFKKILITGSPHIGKTTLIEEMLNNAGMMPDTPIYYCYTKERIENGKRTGYDVVTSVNPISRSLANRNDAKTPLHYDVNVDLLDNIADELNAQENKILVVDEIGLMQMKSEKFKKAISHIMQRNDCVLIGTVTLNSSDNNFIAQTKNNLLCECIQYTRDNHDALLNKLNEELAAALHMYSLVKEN